VVLASFGRGAQQPCLHVQPDGGLWHLGPRPDDQVGRSGGEAGQPRAAASPRGGQVAERRVRGLRREGDPRHDAQQRAFRQGRRPHWSAPSGADVHARVEHGERRRLASLDRHGDRGRRAHRQALADEPAQEGEQPVRLGAVARAPLAGAVAGVPACRSRLACAGPAARLRVARRQAAVPRCRRAVPCGAEGDSGGVLQCCGARGGGSRRGLGGYNVQGRGQGRALGPVEAQGGTRISRC
jgi:hypothetical protein